MYTQVNVSKFVGARPTALTRVVSDICKVKLSKCLFTIHLTKYLHKLEIWRPNMTAQIFSRYGVSLIFNFFFRDT